MKSKLISQPNDELLIFLSGWGCDDNQFKEISCSKNILLCWDYADINFDFDFSRYKKVYLAAYSAGVFAAGLIKYKFPKLESSLAINGNPLMFDKYYGIPPNVIKVFKGLNLSNYMDFRLKYLVTDEAELKEFNKNPSLRSFEDCFAELDALIKYSKQTYPIMEFDRALIGEKDKIFNPSRQKEYFKGKYAVLENCAHDVFTRFKNFDDILNLSAGIK